MTIFGLIQCIFMLESKTNAHVHIFYNYTTIQIYMTVSTENANPLTSSQENSDFLVSNSTNWFYLNLNRGI